MGKKFEKWGEFISASNRLLNGQFANSISE